MPYTVAVSFDKFIENISTTGDHKQTADTRRDAIVELLKDKFTITEAFATGSLVRGTGLKSHADVDVIVALHHKNHIEGKSPARVLEDVRERLKDYDARMVKKNGQAVTLYFKTWPNVDIVPAVQVASSGVVVGYQIPDMNRGVWIDTYPQAHDRAMSRLSGKDLVRIRMIKTWNKAHSECLSSFHIETLALNVPTMTGTWAWEIVTFFSKALELIDKPLFHPNTGNGQVDSYLTVADKQIAKARLTTAKDLATLAWYYTERDNNDEEAIGKYRTLFGERFPAYG